MKQVCLQQSAVTRLSSYQRQARQYVNSPTRRKANLTKGSLMALVPLMATSVVSNAQTACSFNSSIPLIGTATMYIDLPINGLGGTDFVVRYSSGPNLYVQASGALNAIKSVGVPIATGMTFVMPRYANGATINAADFVANTARNVYAASSLYASPQTPLTFPTNVAIRGFSSGFRYGFLNIDVVTDPGTGAKTLVVYGGITSDRTDTTAGIEMGNCPTLPVELTSFQAVTEEKTIALSWETATEINNLGFEVQRSDDGKEFEKITWLDGNGTTAEQQHYSYKDDKISVNQVYYYRLMQVDINGSIEYSEVITARLKSGDQNEIGEIYPNPSQQFANLSVSLVQKEDIEITIYNGHGRTLINQTQTLEKGTHELAIDLNELPTGNYYAKIRMETQVFYRKILRVE